MPHVNDTTDASAIVHVVESLVDGAEVLAVSDELVDLQFAVHVVVDETTHLRATLDAAEGATFPYATGDELESCLRESKCQFSWII